jgi:hypothetical protein
LLQRLYLRRADPMQDITLIPLQIS